MPKKLFHRETEKIEKDISANQAFSFLRKKYCKKEKIWKISFVLLGSKNTNLNFVFKKIFSIYLIKP